jgi:hypothetical protein
MASAGKPSSFADRLRALLALALAVALGALAAAGCRSDPNYPKVPAIDLDEDDGGVALQPAPGDFSSEDGLAQRYPVEIVPFFEGGTKSGFRGDSAFVAGGRLRYVQMHSPFSRGFEPSTDHQLALGPELGARWLIDGSRRFMLFFF